MQYRAHYYEKLRSILPAQEISIQPTRVQGNREGSAQYKASLPREGEGATSVLKLCDPLLLV